MHAGPYVPPHGGPPGVEGRKSTPWFRGVGRLTPRRPHQVGELDNLPIGGGYPDLPVTRLLGGFIALLVLSACSVSDLLQPTPTLTIGAIYPLSGPQATGGREELA